MSKSLLELAAEIVQAQVTVNHMSAETVESALKVIYNTLRRIQAAEENGCLLPAEQAAPALESGGGELRPGLSPAESIQEDKVVCLECGAAFRQLTANHLRGHGLTPREYKKKYQFPLKQPLSAKALTAIRSRKAKERGLPENLRSYQAQQRKRKLGAGEKKA